MRIIAVLCALLILGSAIAPAQDPAAEPLPPFEFYVKGDKGVDVALDPDALKGMLPDDVLATASVIVRRAADAKEETFTPKPGALLKMAKLKPGDQIEYRAGAATVAAIVAAPPEQRRHLLVDEQALGADKCLRLMLLNSCEPEHAPRASLAVDSRVEGVSAEGGEGAGGDHPKKSVVKGGLSARDSAKLNGKKVLDLLRKPKRFLQGADDACSVFLLKHEDLGAEK